MNHDPLEAQLSGSLTTVEDENAATVSPSFLGCETLLVVARTQSVKKQLGDRCSAATPLTAR